MRTAATRFANIGLLRADMGRLVIEVRRLLGGREQSTQRLIMCRLARIVLLEVDKLLLRVHILFVIRFTAILIGLIETVHHRRCVYLLVLVDIFTLTTLTAEVQLVSHFCGCFFFTPPTLTLLIRIFFFANIVE